jgi:hypothetical protein
LEFGKGLREKEEKMRYERKTYFTWIGRTLVEGAVFIRADDKRKESGSFQMLAYWIILSREKVNCWRENKNMEPK